jgi:hypothetical protein
LLNKNTPSFTDPAWYFDDGVFVDTIYDEDFAAFHRDSDEYKTTLGIRTKCLYVEDPPTVDVPTFAKACATKIKFVLNNFSAGEPPLLTYAAYLNVSN